MELPDALNDTRVQVGIVVALVVVVGVAGAFATGMLSQQSEPSVENQVPANVDAVTYVDGEIIRDEATTAVMNSFIEQSETAEYDNYNELLAEANNETEADIDGFNEAVAFSRVSEDSDTTYTGYVISAEWSEEEVVSSMSETRDYSESTYNGHTVYAPQSEFSENYFAVLGNGMYVFGTEQAVKDTIDVYEGDANTFNGELRSEYDSLDNENALVKFAADVPEEQIDEDQVRRQSQASPVNLNPYTNVEYVSGVYYSSDQTVGTTMYLTTTNESAAQNVNDVTDGAISVGSGAVQNETAKEALRNIEVSQSGDTVTVQYESSISRLEALIRVLNQMSGVGV